MEMYRCKLPGGNKVKRVTFIGTLIARGKMDVPEGLCSPGGFFSAPALDPLWSRAWDALRLDMGMELPVRIHRIME